MVDLILKLVKFEVRFKQTWVALVVSVFLPLQALSWGAEGHQVIAKLAESQLTPKARSEINRLLSMEPDATWHPYPPGQMNTAIQRQRPGITSTFPEATAPMSLSATVRMESAW
jgi:hypothetical protein